MVLKLEDVKYRYGAKYPFVLNGINYEFEEGVMYAVMGESGAGKTTLLAMLAMLDDPTEGYIKFNGMVTTLLDPDNYRAEKVSVIFQQYNLLMKHTVIDNVKIALYMSGYEDDYDERAAACLDEVRFSQDKHNRVVQFLSGGEQQRVAIARALASDSQVILADEPTGNLDKTNTKNILSVLRDLKDKYNKCVIIVTHSDEVASYADKVINMYDGQIV